MHVFCAAAMLFLTTLAHGQLMTRSDWQITEEPTVAFEQDQITVTKADADGDQWLLSKRAYQNFELTGQCYLGPDVETAILLRYTSVDDLPPSAQAYEVSLDHDEHQQNPTGSIRGIARGLWQPSYDTAGWFDFVIRAYGDHLSVSINGTKVAEVHARRSRSGHVGLKAQTGTGARFRNVSLVELSTPPTHGPLMEDYLHARMDLPLTSLFDGKSLDGWRPAGNATWQVSDGIIHGYSGAEGGWLVSDETYHNFYLKLKFKIIKEDNSGIFIRKPAEAPIPTLQNSIECNIYDHNGYAHAFSTGSFVLHARAWSNMVDYDDWNFAEIYAMEDQVAMYINGKKAAEAHIPTLNHRGNICLQAGIQVFSKDKGPSDIYFKDIFVRSLD